MDESSRRGLRVLIVEDEFFLASELRQELEAAGHTIAGMCPDAASARAFLEENDVDCALLDINLGNIVSFELADLLKARAIPFVFVTGYDQRVIPEGLRNRPYVSKPARMHAIRAALEKLFDDAGTNRGASE